MRTAPTDTSFDGTRETSDIKPEPGSVFTRSFFTFPQDMTEAERNVMRERVSHWTELAEKRTAIVFGPVIDPTQVWGVAIVEVEDESEARALVQDDPVTKAGLGRIEIYPMGPGTIVRD